MKKNFLFLMTFVLGFVAFMPNVFAATTDPQFCVRTSEIWQFVGYGLFALKILVPIIIIIFGVIDFAKAAVSNDDSAIKKAGSSLLRRAIVGICIFFVPTIVNVLFDMIENVAGSLDGIKACETCLLTPTDTECDEYIRDADNLRGKSN